MEETVGTNVGVDCIDTEWEAPSLERRSAMTVRDRPLHGCWRLDGFEFPHLGGTRKTHLEANNRILAEAITSNRLNSDRWISYGRRPAFYANPNRYQTSCFSYATFPPAIDALTKMGILENRIVKPNTRGTQSTFRLRESAIREFGLDDLTIEYDPAESLILRDAEKKRIDYPDDEFTHLSRTNLKIINAGLASVSIELAGQRISNGDVIKVGLLEAANDNNKRGKTKIPTRTITIGPTLNHLHRVFNVGSLERGGRFYGGFWQGLSKVHRGEITIDGALTAEADYPGIHPTLLYAERGLKLNSDPYVFTDWDRSLVKRAFNIMVNADDDRSAEFCIALGYIKGKGCHERARALMRDIRDRHHYIARAFCSGAGRYLQFIDSGIAETVVLEMLRKYGAICLPIHDSFIVKQTHCSLLAETMQRTLSAKLHDLGLGASSTGFNKTVPQYGEMPLPILGASCPPSYRRSCAVLLAGE